MWSLKYNKGTLLVISFALLVCCASYYYWNFITSTDFFHNEGSSLACAFYYDWKELLRGGSQIAQTCTYDHMPLYFYLLKVVEYMGPMSFTSARIPSLLFAILSNIVLFIFFKRFFEKKLPPVVLLGALAFVAFDPFSSYITLQARMHGLYQLTSILLVVEFSKDKIDLRRVGLLAVVAVLNFYFSVFLLATLLFSSLLFGRIQWRSLLRPSMAILLAIVLYKLPYLIYRRYVFMAQDLSPAWSSFDFYILGPLMRAKGYLIVVLLGLVLSLYYAFRRGDVITRVFAMTFVIQFASFVFLVGANTIEVAPRYYLFLYPLSWFFVLTWLGERDKSQKLKLAGVLFLVLLVSSHTIGQTGQFLHRRQQAIEDEFLRIHRSHPKALVVTDSRSYFEIYFYVYLYLLRGQRFEFSSIDELRKSEQLLDMDEVIFVTNFVYSEDQFKAKLSRFLPNYKVVFRSDPNIVYLSVSHLVKDKS